jgi:hypothetical protein
MSEPENFLTRWSRRKREAEAAPEPGGQAQPDAAAAEEPAIDLSSLPSLDDIGAGTDISSFMKPGVPAALRHAALRRAWVSDPAIRDFRGLQENDWDFNAPDGVPGFGTFKSQDEVKALAQRLFADKAPESEPDSQAGPNDSGDVAPLENTAAAGTELDKHQAGGEPAEAKHTAPESEEGHDAAVQRTASRRHGGALPQ